MDTLSTFTIDTDPNRLQIEAIHDFLSNHSYWAKGRTLDIVRKSIANSLCFGVYDSQGEQVGFARLVTDRITFAWLCDVYILERVRGQGLGKHLVEAVINHPDLKDIKRILLTTRDAHELYRRYGGFELISSPETMMFRLNPDFC